MGLIVSGLALSVFVQLAGIFSLVREAAPDHIGDAQEKNQPEKVAHGIPILTPISINSKPNKAMPMAMSQSMKFTRPARNRVSKGAKTNNRMPISRIASAHSSYRALATAGICILNQLHCPVLTLAVILAG